MTRVYLIRHAEAEGNIYHVAQGHFDGMVTKKGYQQIQALKERFADIEIDAVYSSPLFRTRETAKAIYESKNLPLNIEPGFIEINFGPWEGKTWYEIEHMDSEQLDNFRHHPYDWHVSGIESIAEVKARFYPTLMRVAKENDGKTIAVFTHGAVLRYMMQNLLNYTEEQANNMRVGDNTSVSLLEIEGNEIEAVYVNDDTHLKERNLSTLGRVLPPQVMRVHDSEYYRELTQEDAQTLNVSTDGYCRASCIDDEIIGAFQLLFDDSGNGKIGYFFLRPEWRNLRLGTQMLGHVVLYYRERGIDIITIKCPERESRGFFERFGFVQLENDVYRLNTGYAKRYDYWEIP